MAPVDDSKTSDSVGKRGRPALDAQDEDSSVLAVNIDGHVITWSDSSWAGDKGLITEARAKSDARVMVALVYLGEPIMADEENLLGALACMVAINPGRARILSAPGSVNSYLSSPTLGASKIVGSI